MKVYNAGLIADKKLLVICPSRGRAGRIDQMLKSFRDMSSSDAGLLIIIDADDPQLPEYRKILSNLWTYAECPQRRTTTQIHNWAVNYFNAHKYYSSTNDDFEYKTPKWDQKLIRAIEENGGWGIAYGSDGIQNQNLCTTSVISANIIRTLGWLQMPKLTHLYGDNVWMQIGKAIERLYFVEDVKIQHHHPVDGKTQADSTAAQTNSREMYSKDGRVFETWCQSELPDVAGRIIRQICAGKKVPSLSLAMIVGDFEKPEDFKRCLDSVKGWVDEIKVVFNFKHIPSVNVVRLQKVLENSGIKHSWKYKKWSDFSSIRNMSLDMCSGEYIIYLDCDDVVQSPWRIKDTLFKDAGKHNAIYCFCISHKPEGMPSENIRQPRIFRNKPEHRFRNRCHEDITYSIMETSEGVKSTQANIYIEHFGNIDPIRFQKKNQRNIDLLLKDISEGWDHSLTYFGLVNSYITRAGKGDFVRAMETVDKCFAKFPPSAEDPLTPRMWNLRGLACLKHHLATKDGRAFEGAKHSYLTCWLDYKDISAGVDYAGCLIQEQNYADAEKVLLEVNAIDEYKTANMPFDIRTSEYVLFKNLGLCQLNLKKLNEAEESLKRAAQYGVDYEAVDLLAEVLRQKGQHDMAAHVTIQAVNRFPNYGFGFFNLSQYEMMNNRMVTAKLFLRRTLEIMPNMKEAKHNMQMLEKVGA